MIERLARPIWALASVGIWLQTLRTTPWIALVFRPSIRYMVLYLMTTDQQIRISSVDGLRVVWVDLNLWSIPQNVPLLRTSDLGTLAHGPHRSNRRHIRVLHHEQRQLVN